MSDRQKTIWGVISAIVLAINLLAAVHAMAAVPKPPGAQDDGSFLVADFVLPSDCAGRPRCDLAPAVGRAMKLCAKAHPSNLRAGCRLRLPLGEFDLVPKAPKHEAVRICRAHILQGAAAGGWGAATTLWVPCHGSGIRVAYHDECRAAGEGGGGGWSQIRGVAIKEQCGTTTSTRTTTYGIRLEARAHLEDVWVRGFAIGVWVDADKGSKPRSNANLWSMERPVINGAAHSGVRVKGGDSNGGLGSLVDSSSNCIYGSRWAAALGECANIIDRSFLGNMWAATHVATARDRLTKELFRGYLFVGGNQRSLLAAPYGEGDSKPGLLSPWSNVIAGLSAWEEGWGQRLEGPRVNRLEAWSRRDPKNPVRLIIGDGNLGGAAITIYAPAGNAGWPLSLVFDATRKSWAWRVANSAMYDPIRIGGTHEAPGGLGSLTLSRVQ